MGIGIGKYCILMGITLYGVSGKWLTNARKTAKALSMTSLMLPPNTRKLFIKKPGAGDLAAFLSAALMHSALIGGCFLFMWVMRPLHPKVYSSNVLAGTAPFEPANDLLGWWHAGTGVTIDEVQASAGLDHAMFRVVYKAYEEHDYVLLVGL